jgi:hypothetical protein
MEAPPNLSRSRLTITHYGPGRMLTLVLVNSALIETLYTDRTIPHEGGRVFHLDCRNNPWVNRREDAVV